MSDDEFIPERLQRILERIARRINETEKLDAPVSVRADWWTPRIFLVIEDGQHRFEQIQDELGIARNILADRLRTMVDLGILKRQMYSEKPKRFEYFINSDGDDGTSGQPAIVLV
jgi:DNA-binding HxlR family transcriptional regulator